MSTEFFSTLEFFESPDCSQFVSSIDNRPALVSSNSVSGFSSGPNSGHESDEENSESASDSESDCESDGEDYDEDYYDPAWDKDCEDCEIVFEN